MSASMTETALASHKAKVGNRYFKVDEGYDKRVYENDAANYAKICGVFAFFYGFVILFWWANFEFGIWDTEGYTKYSIVIFLCTVAFLCGMLLSGKIANQKKRHHLFLEEKISEIEAQQNEAEERRNQELLYAQKLAKKNQQNRA